MPLLSEVMSERGWNSDDVAAVLAEKGVTLSRGDNKGAPITTKIVNDRLTREVARPWRDALGLGDSPEPPSGKGDPGGSLGGRRETPPKRPAEAQIQIQGPDNAAIAEKRIADLYRFLGGLLAAGSGAPGVSAVWNDSADPIARAWLETAKENVWAARFVRMMEAGGAGGELVYCHVLLLGGTLYVLGAGIPAGEHLFAKYAKHRIVTAPQHPAAEANGGAEAQEPVASAAAAEGAVVDGPG